MKIEFKTKSEFIRKIGIFVIGVPKAFITGITIYILLDNNILKYFLTWEFLFHIIFFTTIGGLVYGYLWGEAIWRRYVKSQKKNDLK